MKKEMTITLTKDDIKNAGAKATSKLMHTSADDDRLTLHILIIGAAVIAEMTSILFDENDKGDN